MRPAGGISRPLDAVHYFATVHFGYDANLGPDGQNDDLEAPSAEKRADHGFKKPLG